MDFKDLFNLKGINYWHLANAAGLNLLWTGAILVFTLYFLEKAPDTAAILQSGLILGIFIGTLGIGWLVGKMAADQRGPTYGVIGSLASTALIIFLILPSGGILGLLLIFVALAGGLNGGLLSIKARKKGK